MRYGQKVQTHTHTRYTREIYDIFIYAHTLYIDLLNTHTRNKRETSHETYLLRIQKRYTRDTIDLLDIRTPTIDSWKRPWKLHSSVQWIKFKERLCVWNKKRKKERGGVLQKREWTQRPFFVDCRKGMICTPCFLLFNVFIITSRQSRPRAQYGGGTKTLKHSSKFFFFDVCYLRQLLQKKKWRARVQTGLSSEWYTDAHFHLQKHKSPKTDMMSF